MIRDPSDGSVREAAKPVSENLSGDCQKTCQIDSGLAPDHSNRAARLQKSREWLQDYHQKKGK